MTKPALRAHPIAELVPDMTPDQYSALRYDIREHGPVLKHAAGRYGDTPTRCNSDLRARSSLTHTAFPGLDQSISLPLPFLDLPHRRRINADPVRPAPALILDTLGPC